MAGASVAEAADKKDTTKPLMLQEPHVCRGLNPSCERKGGKPSGKKHDCAGQSRTVATAADHTCGGANDCAGLGGCGETPGENTCKGKGGCGVPIPHDGGWDKARKAFEKAMDKAGKKYGPAPKKA